MTVNHLYPTTRPTLDLNFARQKRLDPRVTFTRGSTATYVGDDGLIKTAASNEARFDHDPATGESLGLLVEEARTNYTPDGTGFTVTTGNGRTAPSRGTFSSTSIVNPTGSAGTTLFTTDVSSGISIGISGGDNSQGSVGNAMSMFVKPNGITKIFLSTYTTAANQGAYFDLTGEGSVAGVQTSLPLDKCFIHSYPNGWYRIGVRSSSGAAVTYSCLVWEYDASNNPQFSSVTGDGTSGFYIWGWQNEVGKSDFWTSVIPTSGSTVTRSADVASMTGTNFSSWYNQSEGSIMFSSTPLSSTSTNATNGSCIFISDNTNNNFVAVANEIGVASGGSGAVSVSGSFQFASGRIGSGIKQRSVALAYQVNNFALSAEGLTAVTGTSGTLPTVDRMRIGAYLPSNPDYYVNGTISRLTYYPTRLTDSQLQELTR